MGFQSVFNRYSKDIKRILGNVMAATKQKNKQIKSKARVREHAEVFTAEKEVKAMCDLIPSEVWENKNS